MLAAQGVEWAAMRDGTPDAVGCMVHDHSLELWRVDGQTGSWGGSEAQPTRSCAPHLEMPMNGVHVQNRVVPAVVFSLAVGLQACTESIPVERRTVSLKNTETFEYPTVGGDEEGARISVQAKHYSISEIRRGPATNWVAVYVYQPLAGFVGTDSVEIEILTGSDGASPPDMKKAVFRFLVAN